MRTTNTSQVPRGRIESDCRVDRCQCYFVKPTSRRSKTENLRILISFMQMHQRNAEDLLELVQNGDETAATELYQRYIDRLIHLARSRLSPKLERRVDPEDVVQSVYRSFFRRVADGRYQLIDEEQLWHLLAAITVNKARKAYRRHSAEKRAVSSEESTAKSLAMANVSPTALAQQASPEEAAVLIEETERMMSGLTPKQREIVQMHLQGRTSVEIAEEAGCSERTVHRAVERARVQLEKLLFVDDDD